MVGPHVVYGKEESLYDSPKITWRPEDKRKRSRQRTTWRRTVESEREEMGFASWEAARNMTKDRNGWSKCILASCA